MTNLGRGEQLARFPARGSTEVMCGHSWPVWEGPTVGKPSGDMTQQVLEYVGLFGGLGVVSVFLAAFALGRFAVVGVREGRTWRASGDTQGARNRLPAASAPKPETAGPRRFPLAQVETRSAN